MEIALDVLWEVSISGLPGAILGVLPLRHAEMVVLAVLGAFDVLWLDLWDFERPKSDVPAQLLDYIVAVTLDGSPQFFEFLIGHPDVECPLPAGALQTHCRIVMTTRY